MLETPSPYLPRFSGTQELTYEKLLREAVRYQYSGGYTQGAYEMKTVSPEEYARRKSELAARFYEGYAPSNPLRPLENPEIAEIDAMVRAISYKPGTTIRFVAKGGLYFYRPGIEVHMVVVDTENHAKPFDLKANFHMYDNSSVRRAIADKNRFYDWVFRLLVWLEGHECGEFFKVGGEKTHDPHTSGYASRYPVDLQSYPQFR